MPSRLSCIAVDLTPVLPGGENGGAKVFVLELLRRLAALKPWTRFLLLTQAASHEELAWLDRSNVQRLMVVGAEPPRGDGPPASRLMHITQRVLPFLPAGLRTKVLAAAEERDARERRWYSDSLLGSWGVDLLFCPFTAPTYHQPDVPTVCTVHDLQYKTYPDFFPPQEVAARDAAFVAACRHASAIAAVSDYSRQSVVQHGGFDAQRIRTIHPRMARRIAGARAAGRDVLAAHGLQPRGYLLFPANFWRHKNHEAALTAFAMACGRGLPAGIRLVCTGAPGPRQAALVDLASAMGLRERVLFPGYVGAGELGALLAHSAGMVFPSLYEGFGLPVIEAMAAGVPVACSNATSLPEVAAGAALLFDPQAPQDIAQAMVRLVTDRPLRRRLERAGRRRARDFADAGRMAREYWSLFEFALANPRPESGLIGNYADGWSGPVLNVQVAPAGEPQVVELHLTAPGWLPESVGVSASLRGQPQGEPVTIARGGSGVFSLPVEAGGGCYQLKFEPSFVPAQAGVSPDDRELTALIEACSIVTATGERQELFARKVEAG